MKKILFFMFMLVVPFIVNAVEIEIGLDGEFNSFVQFEGVSTADKDGFVVVGSVSDDTFIKKYNFDKEIIWSKNYSGTGVEYLYDVEMTNDGYIIVGYTSSTDISGLVNKGKKDAYILKLDFNGELVWMKSFGGSEDDIFYDVEVLNDGSYIAVGSSLSKDLDSLTTSTSEDGIVVKYDVNGNVIFTDILAGNSSDIYRGASATDDGGYIIVGSTLSSDIEFTLNVIGDGILFKYNSSNELVWKQKIGLNTPALGNGIYGATFSKDKTLGLYDVIQASDGGYVVVGKMQENQAVFEKGTYGANVAILYPAVMKYDSNGNYLWGDCLEEYDGAFYDVTEASDGTYYVVGTQNRNEDSLIVNYSNSGEEIKEYVLDGDSYEAVSTNIEMIYNNYIMVVGKFSGENIKYSTQNLFKNSMFKGKYNGYFFDIDYVYNIENVTEDPNGNVEVERVNGLGLARVSANTGYKVYNVKVLDADNNELTVVDNGDGTYSFPLSKDVRVEVTFMEDVDNPKTFDSSFLIILISLFFGGVVALLFYLILKHDKVSIEL